jgi:hypothetical protein
VLASGFLPSSSVLSVGIRYTGTVTESCPGPRRSTVAPVAVSATAIGAMVPPQSLTIGSGVCVLVRHPVTHIFVGTGSETGRVHALHSCARMAGIKVALQGTSRLRARCSSTPSLYTAPQAAPGSGCKVNDILADCETHISGLLRCYWFSSYTMVLMERRISLCEQISVLILSLLALWLCVLLGRFWMLSESALKAKAPKAPKSF